MSAPADPPGDDALVEALTSSQRLGMLGAAPAAEIIDHAEAFLPPLAHVTGTVVDLGSGGGVPGLVIAWRRPDLRLLLVDRRMTRTDHLRRLVHRLRLTDRVDVINADAAALPHFLDAPVDAVVVRGFGPSPTVLAAAMAILVERGVLAVSEPPAGHDVDRWPEELLARHGVERVDDGTGRVAVFRPVSRRT